MSGVVWSPGRRRIDALLLSVVAMNTLQPDLRAKTNDFLLAKWTSYGIAGVHRGAVEMCDVPHAHT